MLLIDKLLEINILELSNSDTGIHTLSINRNVLHVNRWFQNNDSLHSNS